MGLISFDSGMDKIIAGLIEKYPAKKSVIIEHMSQCKYYSGACAFLDDLRADVSLAKLKGNYAKKELKYNHRSG